jgi:DNA-binding helix-hairpin-helix protein with protein kinase domain
VTALRPQGLPSGQRIATSSGRSGTVGALLGSGGQGDVYALVMDGVTFALKWYHPHYVQMDATLRMRLDRSVRRGAPTEDFLWPLDLVDLTGSTSFGYVMPLRADSFVSIRDLIAPPPRRLDLPLGRRAAICLHLARNFLELHASGFCYQDINFGNVFIEPASGRVLICDNDNVNVDGADASIYGTRKFMAPEVVRREVLPSSRTDLFSLAVLFFYILLGWHPLDGRREAEIKLLNAPAELRLYGTEPLFMFDAANTANGPVEGFHDPIVARWESLPSRLRGLFERAFTQGLHNPAARILETEWRNALAAVPDAVFACGECGFEHVADKQFLAAGSGGSCRACMEPLAMPPILILGDRALTLEAGRTIGRELLDGRGAATPAARVDAHPQRPELLGLRNLTDAAWKVTLSDASAHSVAPGQTVRILPGSTIYFGRQSGVIAGGVAVGPGVA